MKSHETLQPDTDYTRASGGLVFQFRFTSKRDEAAADGALALRQVHGRKVEPVTVGSVGREADAWVFEGPSQHRAVIFVADCLPVALFAPETGKAAIVHAGHRGLSGRILQEAVEAVRGDHRESPVEAWLGPCIGPCCYQVQQDVAGTFQDWPEGLQDHPSSGFLLHLQRVAARQLADLGVTVAGAVAECTFCHPDLYHSYRRDGAGRRGRHMLVAGLRMEP